MTWKSQGQNETCPLGSSRPKIMWDCQIQTAKLVMANQPYIIVVDKQRKTAVVIDVAIPSTKQYQEDGTREA